MLYRHFHEFDLSIKQITTSKIHFSFFLFAMILMPLNWFMEIIRWKIILNGLFPVTWRQSIESVLTGTALGFITPARIGDYAGRVILLPEQYRIPSLACLFFNSIIQNSIHVLGGILFSAFFLHLYWPNYFSFSFLGFVVVAFVLMALVTIFLLPKLSFYIMNKLAFLRESKWAVHFEFLKNVPFPVITAVVAFSIFRYGVYFMQYLLILEALDVNVSWLELSSGVAFIYILQSGMPLPPLLSFLGRTEIAILVWGQLQISATTALIATLSLWIMNLVIPSVVGYIILFRKNLKGIK